MVSAYVESDLDGLEEEQLQAHLGRVSDIFQKLTHKTNGVLTCFYRIDPTVSDKVEGFWYVNLDGEAFEEYEVTNISLFNTEDTSRLVWFTVPKSTGKAAWLPPYITETLGAHVLAYSIPVFYEGRFVGVVGIEIDYSTMTDEVNNITLYDNGYAFLNDAEGNLVYHPRMDVTTMETQQKIPDGLLSDDEFIRYSFEGVEKQAVSLPLSNGMRLSVTVPVREINADWHNWSDEIAVVFAVLLLAFILLLTAFVGHIIKPLQNLTRAAEQISEGHYDCELNYDTKDEVGVLTVSFTKLIAKRKTSVPEPPTTSPITTA